LVRSILLFVRSDQADPAQLVDLPRLGGSPRAFHRFALPVAKAGLDHRVGHAMPF
jgi:hypothetical protein